MTCPFCGIEDERIGERHYQRHQIEALRRIAKALEALGDILDERLPVADWKSEKVKIEH